MPGASRFSQPPFDSFRNTVLSGTTTKKIAEAAGVSEAMVFRHFATKDELYGAILHSKSCEEGPHRFPWENNEELQKRSTKRTISGFSTTWRSTL